MVVNYVIALPRLDQKKKKEKKKGVCLAENPKGNLRKRRVKKKRVREPARLKTRKGSLGKS